MGLCDKCVFKKQQNIMIYCTNGKYRYDVNKKECGGFKYAKNNKKIREK